MPCLYPKTESVTYGYHGIRVLAPKRNCGTRHYNTGTCTRVTIDESLLSMDTQSPNVFFFVFPTTIEWGSGQIVARGLRELSYYHPDHVRYDRTRLERGNRLNLFFYLPTTTKFVLSRVVL